MNKVIIILYIFLLGCTDNKDYSKLGNNESYDIVKLREISIDDPLILKFTKYQNTDSVAFQNVLVSKKEVKDKNINSDEYPNYFLSDGYLFFSAKRFSCLLNNFLHDNGDYNNEYYTSLKNKVRNAEKDNIWVFEDKVNHKPKFYKGWEYHEIYPRNFTVFLVKGSALRKCQTIDEIVLKEYDNVYFKIIVPVI